MRWTSVNFVFDLASGFVPNDRVLTVPGSKIATVAVNDIFLTGLLYTSVKRVLAVHKDKVGFEIGKITVILKHAGEPTLLLTELQVHGAAGAGGIREKILAAKRAGIKEIILCSENQKDIEDIKKQYLKGLKFHYVINRIYFLCL